MLSLFLPEKCVHCGEPSQFSVGSDRDALSHYLCGLCRRVLESAEPPLSRDVAAELRASAGDSLSLAFARAAYTFVAETPIQSLIHAVKYDGMPRLGELLGLSIASLVPQGVDMIIPVPLHRTRFAERGFNQAEAIANGISQGSGLPVVAAARRERPTPTQTRLNIAERQENMAGAFGVTKAASSLKGKHILIIDDVMTTGATLISVAGTLARAHPRRTSVLTIAIADWATQK